MKSRILELDALRGIASLSVVVYHFTMNQPVAKYGFKYGITGVDMFFIISGFVIFLTLANTKHWKDFIVSRFSRLYPTYWISVTLTFFLILCYSIAKKTVTFSLFIKYVANMTMFQHYLGIGDLDPPYWTMIVEMNFYILMFILYRSSLLGKVEIIGFFIVLFSLINSLFLADKFNNYVKLITFIFPLLNYFPLFLSGIVFYKLKFSNHTLFRYLLLLFCFIAQVSLFNIVRASPLYVTTPEYILILVAYYSIFLLYTFNLLSFIINKVTVFFGSISFSFYLIHQNLGTSFIIPKANMYVAFPISFCIALIVSILIAYLITRFVEQPSLRYIRDKYKKYKTYIETK